VGRFVCRLQPVCRATFWKNSSLQEGALFQTSSLIHWPPHSCKARSFDISFAQQKPCDLTRQKIHPSFSLSSYKLRLCKPTGAATSSAGTLGLPLSCASISDQSTHKRLKIWNQVWPVWPGRS